MQAAILNWADSCVSLPALFLYFLQAHPNKQFIFIQIILPLVTYNVLCFAYAYFYWLTVFVDLFFYTNHIQIDKVIDEKQDAAV